MKMEPTTRRAMSMYLKRRILYLVKICGMSADVIHSILISGDPEYEFTLDYLRRIVSHIHNDPMWAKQWVSVPPYHSGRPRMLSAPARHQLLRRITEENNIRLHAVTMDFADSFYNGVHDTEAPSMSTVRRTLTRASLSRKVLTYIHQLVNHQNRLRYYLNIAYVHPINLVDIDAMASTIGSFVEKYGWAPVGADAIRMQIKIGNTFYPTYAAYTPYGFLCWEIYPNEAVTAEIFQQFLSGRVRTALQAQRRRDEAFCIVDNASLHHTIASEDTLEEVFNGRYMFSEPYCHMDKPIEKGFANVKNYLRAHDREALRNPLDWINRAFFTYSIDGEQAFAAFNHWAHYFENHNTYLQEFAILVIRVTN